MIDGTENVDVCENAALFTVGAKRVPVGSFLARVIVAYTDFPQLEPALQHACRVLGISDFALVDLRRAIIAVMRDRGATVEADGAGTRFVWPSFDQPVRQRIVEGLRELAIDPGRWMTPDPAEPVDCEGDAADATISLIDSLMDRIAYLCAQRDAYRHALQDIARGLPGSPETLTVEQAVCAVSRVLERAQILEGCAQLAEGERDQALDERNRARADLAALQAQRNEFGAA